MAEEISGFEIKLGKEAQGLSEMKLRLILTNKADQKPSAILPEPKKGEEFTYFVPAKKIPNGEFELQAQVGIALLIDIPAPRPAQRDGCAVLLEDIQDPGNVGTILRTAAAAGVDTIYLSPACADCWSPKVLRAAMGAHFGINIVERANLPQVAGDFAGSVIATHLAAAVSLYSLDLTGPVAIVFGNEGQGVSADLLQQVDTRAIIPMSGRTESLNVGAAAAICLFERVRQLAVLQRR